MIKDSDRAIIDEYFLNGFNKIKAFEKYNGDRYKNANSLASGSYYFWHRKAVKEEIAKRQEAILGDRNEMIDEILNTLRANYFDKEVDKEYTHRDKQKYLELLIKVAGIDKAPKFKDDIKSPFEDTTITINIIEEREGEDE